MNLANKEDYLRSHLGSALSLSINNVDVPINYATCSKKKGGLESFKVKTRLVDAEILFMNPSETTHLHIAKKIIGGVALIGRFFFKKEISRFSFCFRAIDDNDSSLGKILNHVGGADENEYTWINYYENGCIVYAQYDSEGLVRNLPFFGFHATPTALKTEDPFDADFSPGVTNLSFPSNPQYFGYILKDIDVGTRTVLPLACLRPNSEQVLEEVESQAMFSGKHFA